MSKFTQLGSVSTRIPPPARLPLTGSLLTTLRFAQLSLFFFLVTSALSVGKLSVPGPFE